jgi:preprotein translocase subunit SecB
MSAQPQPVFSIDKIYVKDLSLEVPNAPEVFLEQAQPQLEVQLASSGARIGANDLYEVVVTLTVTAKAGDKTVFLVEAAQAAIFTISGVPADDMDPVLGIACPNILFPYARETVASTINRAGFPAVNLAPVNFEAIYAQRVQEQQAQGGPRIEIAH